MKGGKNGKDKKKTTDPYLILCLVLTVSIIISEQPEYSLAPKFASHCDHKHKVDKAQIPRAQDKSIF